MGVCYYIDTTTFFHKRKLVQNERHCEGGTTEAISSVIDLRLADVRRVDMLEVIR